MNITYACLVSAAVWATSTLADYAPLKVGNVWKFHGITMREQSLSDTLYQDELRLEVLSQGSNLDTLFYEVGFRDSTYRRKDGADLILTGRTRYVEMYGRIYRVGEDPTGMAASDSSDMFFLSHVEPAGYAVGGVAPGIKMVEARKWERLPFGYEDDMTAWLIDEVGPYWQRRDQYRGCGSATRRDLLLVSFNGRKIVPGVKPRGFNVPECSIRKGHIARGPSFAGRLEGALVDLLGRVFPPAGLR